MIQLTQGGAYLVNGTDIVADTPEAAREIQAKTGITISKEEAAKNTMAYGILREHNTSGNMDKHAVAYHNVGSYLFTGKYRIGYGYLNIVYRSCGDFEGL